MTSQEFVIWLKGFTEGVHEYNITPKQWDLLKEKLGQVIGDDNKFIERSYSGTPIGTVIGGWGTPNGTTITTTPGTGYITIANPSIASFGTSGSYNPSTSTQANWYPTGSNVTYTANGEPTWYSVNKIENDSREK
jgi:hypothetical protein